MADACLARMVCALEKTKESPVAGICLSVYAKEKTLFVDTCSDSGNFSAHWKSNSSVLLFCTRKLFFFFFFFFQGVENHYLFILN